MPTKRHQKKLCSQFLALRLEYALCHGCAFFEAGKDPDTWMGPGEYYMSCNYPSDKIAEGFLSVEMDGISFCRGFTPSSPVSELRKNAKQFRQGRYERNGI